MFLRGGGGMYRREPGHYEFAGGQKYHTVRPMYATSYPKRGMKVQKNAACGQALIVCIPLRKQEPSKALSKSDFASTTDTNRQT